MPRLSIVIPYRHDDRRLEHTLISVLENRPIDSEIVVVHDGSYSDPYKLGDEVVFVEAEQAASSTRLLNLGVQASCSPVVHTLLDGVTVRAGWCQESLAAFLRTPELCCVCQPVQCRGEATLGVARGALRDASLVRHGSLFTSVASEAVSPRISCGFFLRKSLLAMGGFDESLSLPAAEYSLAWMLSELNLPTTAVVTQAAYQPEVDPITTQVVQQLASLAVAFQVTAPGAGQLIGQIAKGLFTGQLSSALAWTSGLKKPPRHSQAVRLSHARQRLADLAENELQHVYRRAA